MRMAVMGAATALMMGSTTPAVALDQNQTNVINHLGSALAIQARCDEWKVNPVIIGAAITASRLDFRSPDALAALGERIAGEIGGVADKADDVVCMTGRFLYGPQGQQPNVLIAAE